MAWVAAAIAVPESHSETISLYLELKPGQKADLAVVGRTTAAFAEAIREIAFFLDPFLDIKLEFESGTEGSVNLKSIVRTMTSKKGVQATLIAIAVASAGALTKDLRTYAIGKLIDLYVIPEKRLQLTDEDIERIAAAIKNIQDGKVAKEQIRNVYKEAERDTAIESVGAITKPDDRKPPAPVPRSDFPTRALIAPHVETEPTKRISPSTEQLILISPVLLNTDRVWRFQSTGGEFSYHMDDDNFRSEILSGKSRVKEGLRITAKVETHEELQGGVWIPKERHILKVLRRHRSTKHSDLFTPAPKKRKTRKKK